MVLPAPAGGEDLTPGFVPDAGDARPEPDAEADEDAFPDEEPPFGFPEDLPPLVDLALGFIVILILVLQSPDTIHEERHTKITDTHTLEVYKLA